MSDDARHRADRRQLLHRLAGAALAGLAAPAWSQDAGHAPLGPIEPRPTPPPLSLTLHDGRVTRLEAVLRGQVTALQLMFVGCSSTCPVQGAIFAAVQQKLDAQGLREGRLLSVSIDPLGDDAAALSRWRSRLGAGPRWLAAVPQASQAERLPGFVGARPLAARAGDRHTPQVVLFDAQGRLAYRFAELASATDIARGLVELQRRG